MMIIPIIASLLITLEAKPERYPVLLSQSLEGLSLLQTGVYYAKGDMFDSSRREVINQNGRVCIKFVDGPASPYKGQEKIIISTISSKQGQLVVDATGKSINAYSGEEARKNYFLVSGTTKTAFLDNYTRAVWEFEGKASDPRTTSEQDERMQNCLNSQGKYTFNMLGISVEGTLELPK